MSSQDRDAEEHDHKWVRVEQKRTRDEDARSTIHIRVPGERPDADMRQAKREWVRVEKKFLQSMARSRDLAEFAKREVRIRLKELEGED